MDRCNGRAGLFELFPGGRVLERLVIFGQCRPRLTLTSKCVAPTFEGIGEMRTHMVGGFELSNRAIDVAFGESHFTPFGKGEGKR